MAMDLSSLPPEFLKSLLAQLGPEGGKQPGQASAGSGPMGLPKPPDPGQMLGMKLPTPTTK